MSKGSIMSIVWPPEQVTSHKIQSREEINKSNPMIIQWDKEVTRGEEI